VENLLSDVDRQISAIQAELRVLAVSPSLRADDFLAFDRQMREALKIQGTSIVLLDTSLTWPIRPMVWQFSPGK